MEKLKVIILGFKNAGYDYAILHGSDFCFPSKSIDKKETISINDCGVISDRKSFEEYSWPDPDSRDYSRLEKLSEALPEGMKLIVRGEGGVLEM